MICKCFFLQHLGFHKLGIAEHKLALEKLTIKILKRSHIRNISIQLNTEDKKKTTTKNKKTNKGP